VRALAVDSPVAVFIRSGLGNEDFGGPLVHLVVGNAINTARRLWNQTGKPLPKGLWLFVDEAVSMHAVARHLLSEKNFSAHCFICSCISLTPP
jgi:hypothetical protein